MSAWSLPQLLAGLHEDIQKRLETVRRSFGHPGVKATQARGCGWNFYRPLCHFDREGSRYEVHSGGKPATAFLFKLISLLQLSGTVPMTDVKAYAAWLTE